MKKRLDFWNNRPKLGLSPGSNYINLKNLEIDYNSIINLTALEPPKIGDFSQIKIWQWEK